MKKKIIAVITAIITSSVLCSSLMTSATFDPSKDPNGDGTLNLADALYIYQYLNGVYVLTDTQINQLDMNCNGIISEVDALALLYRDSGGVLS